MKNLKGVFALLIAALSLTSCGGKTITREQALETAKAIQTEVAKVDANTVSFDAAMEISTKEKDQKEEHNNVYLKLDMEHYIIYSKIDLTTNKTDGTQETMLNEGYIWVNETKLMVQATNNGKVEKQEVDMETSEAAIATFKSTIKPMKDILDPVEFTKMYIDGMVNLIGKPAEEGSVETFHSKGAGHLRIDVEEKQEGLNASGYYEFENNMFVALHADVELDGSTVKQRLDISYGVPTIKLPK